MWSEYPIYPTIELKDPCTVSMSPWCYVLAEWWQSAQHPQLSHPEPDHVMLIHVGPLGFSISCLLHSGVAGYALDVTWSCNTIFVGFMDQARCQKHESLLAGWCWMHLYFIPESQCKLDKSAVALSRHDWCTWGDAFYLPYWLWTKTTMDSGTQSSFSAWFAVQHFEQPSRGCKLLQFAWKIWSKVKRWIPETVSGCLGYLRLWVCGALFHVPAQTVGTRECGDIPC